MKMRDLINIVEAPGDFEKFRQLGHNPIELAKHVIGGVGDKVSTGAASTKSASTSKNNLGDTTEIKSIIDQVISGKPLDSQSLQALKVFRRRL